ncbi:cohesin subunit SA-1 [Drosophila miranda]|uniref:cohesin subunit SA-1 n=1 Tax=Drosophila miranda TaxID=7229 RepID=UPI0007E7163A|nr:cohesin subunit SA-1 [Drosophila miranda]XP_017139321.1 cohesin subunit SA-1 [Drosophila miranda]XP_033242952.1 cohesin subunit SA-1 [Drosophila miranda]XP_033242953.1 cohesin subunit SA-1 [Drosophila miranda]
MNAEGNAEDPDAIEYLDSNEDATDDDIDEEIIILDEPQEEDHGDKQDEGGAPWKSGKGLLRLLMQKRNNQETTAAEWLELYDKCPSFALVRLMQLVVDASGNMYQIPPETKAPFQYWDILLKARQGFTRTSRGYSSYWKDGSSTPARLSSFLLCLVKALDAKGHAGHVLKEFSSFVLVFSESEVRSFRHAGTLVGLKVMTGMLAADAVRATDLATIWNKMLSQLFVERRLDIADSIRCLCCTELALWMARYPAVAFQLASPHMHLLFEALADTSPKVRECCVLGIAQVYGTEDSRVRLSCLSLVAKYKLCVLLVAAADKEWMVCELALRLFVPLLHDSLDLWSEEEMATIEGLMLNQNRCVAQAAAAIFTQRHLSKEEDDISRIRRVVAFAERFPEYEHCAYLVDALIERSNVVLAWAPMAEMLLTGEEQQNEDSIIIELLTCAVWQSTTGEIPPGRYTKDLVRQEPIAGAKQTATQVLAPVMNRLLRKYEGNAASLSNLLKLPQYFDHEAEEHAEHLPLLIRRLQRILFPQQNGAVMRVAAETLKKVCVPSIWPDIRAILATAVKSYQVELRSWYAAASRRTTIRLVETLQLVAALWRRFDLTKCELLVPVLQNLEQSLLTADNDNALPRDTIPLYLEMCYYGLIWRLADKQKDDAANEDLNSSLTSVICAAFKIIKLMPQRSFPYALTTICDLLVLFGNNKRSRSALYVYQPTIREFELLEDHLTMHLFGAAPGQLRPREVFKELQKKRLALAGYCKILSFNVGPIMRFRCMLQHYDKYYDAFGDLMRATMEKSLYVNATNYGMALMHTVLLVFEGVLRASGGSGVRAARAPEFADLLKLSKRLANTLNTDRLRSRQGVLALHRAGIFYAAHNMVDRLTGPPTENLLFLRVLEVFVPHLLSQDKLAILQHLEKNLPAELSSSSHKGWGPLKKYRTALQLRLKLTH